MITKREIFYFIVQTLTAPIEFVIYAICGLSFFVLFLVILVDRTVVKVGKIERA